MLILPKDVDQQKSFQRILKQAIADGTGILLIEKLLYLHTYGDDGMGEKQRVELRPSSRDGDQYFDVYWRRPASPAAGDGWRYGWVTWMNGGLVGRDGEWSLHT